MSRIKITLLVALSALSVFLLIFSFTLRAGGATDSEPAIQGEAIQGEPGITETVAQIMERERQAPVNPLTLEERPETEEYLPDKTHPPGELDVPSFPVDPNPNSPVSVLLPQTIGTSIAGPGRTADSISVVTG